MQKRLSLILSIWIPILMGAPVISPGETWLREQVAGNYDALLRGLSSSPGVIKVNSRDLPNGALASLVLQQTPEANNGGTINCTMAGLLLRKFGARFDMSFGGQAVPLIWNSYRDCLSETDRNWLFAAMNASLPSSQSEATTADVSYTNMYAMAFVASILFGEAVGGPRGDVAADVGYAMFDAWFNYSFATNSSVHEFASPTYADVQVSSLYQGYIWALRPHARAMFGRALDVIWATATANFYGPLSMLSGSHSRDYDTLLGHGMFYAELYAHGLPGARPLECAYKDPHCEGPWEGAYVGTLEPMTVMAEGYYNLLHPRGYRPSPAILALASVPVREVQSSFISDKTTANGNEAKYGDTYNYITPYYAIGSASQDYITNTHSKYTPNPSDKLITIALGAWDLPNTRNAGRLGVDEGCVGAECEPAAGSTQDDTRQRGTQITLQPDWVDQPYGMPTAIPGCDHPCHLALHPGVVQARNVLLATISLNTRDKTDWFTISNWTSLATNLILPLYASEMWLLLPNGTGYPLIPVPNATSWAFDVPLNSTLAVRVGEGGLAVRLAVVDGAGGQEPTIVLKGDPTGMDLSAIRLAAYHYRGAAVVLDEPHVRFAALLVAEHTPDHQAVVALAARVSQATITSSSWTNDTHPTSFQQWDTTVSFGETRLAVGRNMTCHEDGGILNQTKDTSWNCLLYRRVNESDVLPGPLRVNGKII